MAKRSRSGVPRMKAAKHVTQMGGRNTVPKNPRGQKTK